MGHGLGTGITYCEIAGRLIFLDVRHDRYFCLAGASEAAFRRVALGEAIAVSDRPALARMIADGLLVPGTPPLPCPRPPFPASSLADEGGVSASGVATAGALARLTRARLALRLFGLERTLARLAPNGGHRRGIAPRADVPAVAAAFRKAGLVVSSLDRCLPRSIAIAQSCRRVGHDVDLIIGVRLQPFAAHCWVQQGDRIVSDRLDNVRNFTPILVR